MSQIFQKSEALPLISTTIESTIFIYLIESSSKDKKDLEDDLEDLTIIYDVITQQDYLVSSVGCAREPRCVSSPGSWHETTVGCDLFS